MGSNLFGEDACIWRLHKEGFCIGRISRLVGLADAYVRSVITSVWLDDKMKAKSAKSL